MIVDIKDERGSATVETALIMPFILFVLFSFLFVSIYFMDEYRIEGELICKVLKCIEMEQISVKCVNLKNRNYEKVIKNEITNFDTFGPIARSVDNIEYKNRLGHEQIGVTFRGATAGSSIREFISRIYDRIRVDVSFKGYKSTDLIRFYDAMT